jgi:hypothetical protein
MLREIDDADRALHVLTRLSRTNAQVMDEVLDAAADWISGIARR